VFIPTDPALTPLRGTPRCTSPISGPISSVATDELAGTLAVLLVRKQRLIQVQGDGRGKLALAWWTNNSPDAPHAAEPLELAGVATYRRQGRYNSRHMLNPFILRVLLLVFCVEASSLRASAQSLLVVNQRDRNLSVIDPMSGRQINALPGISQ